jgi:hypothetical protein
MTIQDGTYAARPGAASVYESEKGALVLALVVKIENGPELKSYHTLVNRDGSINTRTVDNLKAWSGWNGVDPFWFMENDLTGLEVEVVIANEPGFTDPSKTFPKVKWVNPPGGGNKMPECADRGAILAKYGAKFRAVAGGVPAGAVALPRVRNAEGGARNGAVGPAAAPPVKPAVPSDPPTTRPGGSPATMPARSGPPVNRPAGATQASAWARLCALGVNLTQEQREEIWFAAVDATGMDQVDMTPAGWAQVQGAIEARFAGGPGAVPLSVQDVAGGPLPAAGEDNIPF